MEKYFLSVTEEAYSEDDVFPGLNNFLTNVMVYEEIMQVLPLTESLLGTVVEK